MGLKRRPRRDDARLARALTAYLAARERGREVWDGLYEEQPNPPATEDAVAAVAAKYGGPLPPEYAAFLRMHDGWEHYEYDCHLLSCAEILDGAADEVLEINVENAEDEDEADALCAVFVIGMSSNDATIVYLEPARGAASPVVSYYCEELGREDGFAEFIETRASDLERCIAEELATQQQACADWDAAVRADKDRAYQAALAERLRSAPVAPYPGLSRADEEALAACAAATAAIPGDAEQLRQEKLEVFLGFIAYMPYVPTADEVTAAARLFRRRFPWTQRTVACAPSDEYARKPIDPKSEDFSEFLRLQTAGHYGLRMVDDDGEERAEHIFNFRGMPAHHGEPMATFLEILVPPGSDAAAVRELVLDCADALGLAHGFAGYVALPLIGEYNRHVDIFYDWARAHWGLQVALADELCNPALTGLHGVSWLTLIDNATAATLAEHGRSLDIDGAQVHRRARGVVVQVGDAPSLGDIRAAYPHGYARVHHVLAPLMSPKLAELRHFRDQGATRAWWHRFEQPAVFAESPLDVLARIDAAATAGDVDGMRALWGRIAARDVEAAACLQGPLSKLAHRLLTADDDKRAALVVYDWLLDYERPYPNDRNNAVCAAWDAPDEAPAIIARALPGAEGNPTIFHNAIGVHTHHGRLDEAVEVARAAAAHYELRLFRKLRSDPDFAPLFERPDFVAVWERMRDRLEPSSSWPPLVRDTGREDAVGRNPGDLAAYRDYAAWLTGAGDPRGALIAAHLDYEDNPRSKPHRKAFRTRLREYIANRVVLAAPALAGRIDEDWFEHGVLHRLYLSLVPPEIRADVLASLADPEWRLLRWLNLNNATGLTLSMLEHLPYLTLLDLRGATFDALDPVAELCVLDQLVLGNTAVTDLSVLSGMTSLRRLDLQGTAVTDLEPISRLPNLELLRLDRSAVTDLAPLEQLPRLCELWLYGTEVSKAQAEHIRGVIKARDVEPGPGVKHIVYGP